MNINNKILQGRDLRLSLNGEQVAGALTAKLSMSVGAIDITNRINGEWDEFLPATHSWMLECDGLYIKDEASFEALKTCFMQNTKVAVSFENHTGQALITEFPLSTDFNAQFKYRIKLLGTGALA